MGRQQVERPTRFAAVAADKPNAAPTEAGPPRPHATRAAHSAAPSLCADAADAQRVLEMLSGQRHHVHTGVALVMPQSVSGGCRSGGIHCCLGCLAWTIGGLPCYAC